MCGCVGAGKSLKQQALKYWSTTFSVRLQPTLYIFFKMAKTHQKCSFLFFKGTCVKIVRVQEFCLFSAIIEFMSLASVFWYCARKSKNDGVTWNSTMLVLFNTKEFNKMLAPIKLQRIKIVMFNRLPLSKKIEMHELFSYIYCSK